MNPATLAQAREAKPKLAALLDGVPVLRGIGIIAIDGGFALKVNLAAELTNCILPGDIDGVPVIAEIVGEIHSL